MQWDVLEKKKILKTIPFEIEELVLKNKTGEGPKHPYHRLVCPDWVNILPITHERKAVLIRQSRSGSFSNVLEVPGGAVDKNETRDSTMAAARELEEETGFSSQRILSLGSINPNPALNTNRLHMFLALGCQPVSERRHFPDEAEQIEVILRDAEELDNMVRSGQIDSALSCLTIMLASRYINIGQSATWK